MTMEQAQAQDLDLTAQPEGQGEETALDHLADSLMGDYEEEVSEAEPKQEEVKEEVKEELQEIEPPQFLRPEQKEHFKALPREGQEIVAKIVKESEAFTTRKSQEIANEAKRIEAYQGLINILERDPNFRQHVFYGYGQNQQAQQPAQDTPPDDPIERIKWEAVQEAEQRILGRLQPHLQQNAQQAAVLQQKQVISEALTHFQRDPDYQVVHGKIIEFVKGLPGELGKIAYHRLDSDPREYAQLFGKFKDELAASKQVQPKQEEPKETKRTTRAPLLEQSGKNAPTREAETAKAKSTKELRQKIKRGEADASDIGDFLENTGILKKLGYD